MAPIAARSALLPRGLATMLRNAGKPIFRLQQTGKLDGGRLNPVVEIAQQIHNLRSGFGIADLADRDERLIHDFVVFRPQRVEQVG